MSSEDEPMEVESVLTSDEDVFDGSFEVESSDVKLDNATNDAMPGSVMSLHGSRLFSISAISSGENAKQFTCEDPIDKEVQADCSGNSVIEVDASPVRNDKSGEEVSDSDSDDDRNSDTDKKADPTEGIQNTETKTKEITSISSLKLHSSEIHQEVICQAEELNLNDQDEVLTYSRGAVKYEDLKCLDYREQLNGVIVDYWLHKIYHEMLSDDQRQRSHFYDTAFFTTLAVDPNFAGWNEGENKKLSAAEKRYNRVLNLPSNQNVNIFEKDFIVIPCLEKEHWFLAIVCFPKLNGAFSLDGKRISTEDTFTDRDADADQNQLPIKQSCILIFDSTRDLHGRAVGAIMKISNFLKITHEKNRSDFKFKSSALVGVINECPQQSNVTDCGLFVLEFVERFFLTSPPNDFRAPMRMKNWFEPAEVVIQKRGKIAADITSKYMDEHGVALHIPLVTLSPK